MLARSYILSIIGCAALAVAGCGGGSSPFAKKSSKELLFVSAAPTWDLDKNNSVTCDEWQRYASELFAEGDVNRDGMLTPEEYQKVIRADRLFETADHAYFDANKDGKVALREMTGKPNPAFQILDKNKDCMIAQNELVHTRQIQRIKKDTSDPSDLPGAGGSGPGRP
ncbi:MAG: hypothetical protein K0U74_14665 [Alphaproteobacteria bacterium]|nr:hypothetical protein [Alphaproteobacteria bacterium]